MPVYKDNKVNGFLQLIRSGCAFCRNCVKGQSASLDETVRFCECVGMNQVRARTKEGFPLDGVWRGVCT
jgi:hypothetical protein